MRKLCRPFNIVYFAAIAALALSISVPTGCGQDEKTWQNPSGDSDTDIDLDLDSDGDTDADADTDADTDTGKADDYPPGPYGIGVFNTISNRTLVDCDGNQVELKDFYKKVKVLWITLHTGWCPVCASQHEFLKEAYRKYKDQGLDIILVLGEDNRPGSMSVSNEFCSQFKYNKGFLFHVMQDDGWRQMGDFVASGVPMQILLDKNFTIRAVGYGWNGAQQEAEYTKSIEYFLAQ